MSLIEYSKRTLRLLEARYTPRTAVLRHQQHTFRTFRSWWWFIGQADFESEIGPYFAALKTLPPLTPPLTIIDAGAAAGLFTLAACLSYPGSTVHAFEPSDRQRALLQRNVRLNHLQDQVSISAHGLWNSETRLPFRTIGDMSALQPVSFLAARLRFEEEVSLTPLDVWARRTQPEKLDLVKMDIEGAEIEALEGAMQTIEKFHPVLLVQAYHPRDGGRTLERCARILESIGYGARELPSHPGLLVATIPAS